MNRDDDDASNEVLSAGTPRTEESGHVPLKAIMLALALLTPACADAPPDTASSTREIEQLPTRFSEAVGKVRWSRPRRVDGGGWGFHHRRRVLAAWPQGFETYHTRLLEGRFKGSTITPLEHRVKFIRPDIAALRWSWRIEGDKDFDGTPRPPRNGMFTMIVEKKAGDWQIVAAQNTNAGPGTAPENEGLVFPIAMPR